MQLSLFEDNRPGILHNMAREFLLARELEQALSVYGQILSEYPGDRQAAALTPLVSEWRDLLSRERCVEARCSSSASRRAAGG